MKSLSWRKISRFYLWIVLLVLAVIIFILIRSPAAGQRQASQDPSLPGISEIGNELTAAKDQPSSTSNSSATMPVPPDDDGNLKPLPEVIPDPSTYTKPPFCPLGNEGPDLYSRCDPCRPWTYVPLADSNAVCIDL